MTTPHRPTTDTPARSDDRTSPAGKAADRPATPAKQPDPGDDAAARADEHTPEDESALESLGRAIGAPLSGEAAEKEPRR